MNNIKDNTTMSIVPNQQSNSDLTTQPTLKINPDLFQNSPIKSFDSFSFPESLVFALKDMGISCPTPIQAATIALAVEGQDVMASAQTGTGKTLAYTLPLMVRLLASPQSNALVLAPTRELAAQVRDILRQLLGRRPAFNMALLIGGESMGKQFAQLKGRPRIIVGTPGRICDHLTRGSLSLKHTGFLVIDEADRMLDMGFSIQLDRIAEYLPNQRQTLMFSATVPSNILKLSQKYLQDPACICVDSPTKAAPNIKQEIVRTTQGEKFPNLMRELNEREGSVIIFVKTKRGADQLADKLRRQDLSADSIHGDLKQRQRDRAILQFRNSKTRIMVATDVAARGLDIPHIRHVINYDLPQCPEDYIHRIGRTARAGSEGNALCLICPDDNAKWNAINRLMNPGAPKEPTGPGNGRFQGRPSKGRSSGKFESRGAGNGRPDFPRKKQSSSDTFGQSWGKPRQENSDNSQGKPLGKSFGNSPKKSSGKPWDRPRQDATGESQGKPWDRPRRDAAGESQGKPWDRPRRDATGESQGKPWDRPRRGVSGDSQSSSLGKPQSKSWGKPRRESSAQQPFQQGAHPSAQPWGKSKPSGFNPNGPKKSPPKRFSRGS
ncbi:MAG: DEAD/DEAH box helicase [Alphaproteobacteria bacterium]|nr:DEAD/DEAH box helicase [Alphaproteobacteria bacterium]